MRSKAPPRTLPIPTDVPDLLFDRAGVGLCLVAPDGTVVRVNEEWVRSTGVERNRVVGEDFLALFPCAREVGRTVRARALAGETVEVPRHPHEIGDRETWWEGRVAPVPMQGGTGFLVTARDVTDEVVRLRAAEWALLEREGAGHERETFLRKVIDAAPSMIFVKDRDGRFVLANEALARCYGTPVAGLIGKTDADFNPNAAEVEAFLRADREVMDSRRERLIPEEPVTTAAGEVRWFSTVKVPLVADDGTADQVLGVATDITDWKRAEEALRASEERFRRLVESSVIGLGIGDETGRLTYVNDVLLTMLGYAREDVRTGRLRWDALTPAEDLTVTARALAELRAGGRPEPYEKVYLAKDGRRVPVLVSVVPIDRGPSGELVLAAYVVDLTARKRFEEALRESEEALREAARRKDEFLATLSHELRNPLAAIASAARVIHARCVAGHDVARPIQILERQVRNSARLLEDLLDVSRITRGLLQLKKEPVLLETVIHGAIDSQRALIDAAGHRLSITMPHEPITVDADPTRLEQIFSNLLNNAVKYTPARGRIALAVEPLDGAVAIRVADNGKGIGADLLPHVFDPFVREEQGLARSKGGLGLGLTLVRRLVELHGGTVEARSSGPGAGSEFTVRLPTVAPAPAAEAEPAAGPADGGHHRILVVEDDFDAAELLAEYLSSLGHEVTIAHDGPAAIEAAASADPEVVVLDIGLPGMDGYEVARRLVSGARGSPPVLVALTGYGQEEDRARSRAAGFAHHLTKPFEPAALERLLAGLRPGGGAAEPIPPSFEI
jgi:PAS domain S-box-containing protein